MTAAEFMLLRRIVFETATNLQNNFGDLTERGTADAWTEIADELERCHTIASAEADRLRLAEDQATFVEANARARASKGGAQ